MKKLITAAMLLLSVGCFAQISQIEKAPEQKIVGKIAPMGSFIAELTWSPMSERPQDSTYTLMFRNQKFKTLNEREYVIFLGVEGTFGQLYGVFKSVFAPENKSNKDYMVSFKLGNTDVTIAHYQTMGIVGAMFMAKNAYVVLTESQVDKLFGKN